MKHPHAELMMQFAQDAMETDKPWELWEVHEVSHGYWRTMTEDEQMLSLKVYRRKPQTIKVNGFDVPAPVKSELENDTVYFVPCFSNLDFVTCLRWNGIPYEMRMLSRGLIHLTKEAAIAHGKAMCGIDPESKE